MGQLTRFLRTANALGRTNGERAALLWRLSKNLRVRLGVARYHPAEVYTLATRFGPVHLRDNFGDVTNLPDLLVDNVYRVTVVEGDGVILDVGANIGLFARWAAEHNPGRAIHCFEPLPDNAAMIRRNCPSAVVNNAGVGREPGVVKLGVDAHGIMATSVTQRWDTSAAEFPVVTLDDYARDQGIQRVAFLKCDTEGMELEVLDGARDLLRRTARAALETHGLDRHRGTLERLTAAGLTIDAEGHGATTGFVHASRRDA